MVLKLPECMTFEEGALIEPASVAVHAIRRTGNVLSKNILVLGAGPIGNLVAQAARGLGADKVMITDINDLRLKIAKDCGIDFTLNPLKKNLSESITENFGSTRADMIFECVGSSDTISQAISLARKGSTIVVVGVFGKKPEVDMGLIQDRELSLIGTLMYQKSDFLSAINLTSAGKLDLKKLITHTFSIRDYKKAYEFLEEDKEKILKIVISL
jgi:L-iditol 2-dehydrogenase